MADGITNRQLFLIIMISGTGFSIVEMPKIMGAAAGTGAWLSLLLAAAFFAIDAVIIVYLGQVYRGKSLFEYSRLLTGKIMSCLFCVVYIVYFFVLLAFVVRSSADIIRAEILYKTPVWATMLLILFISLFAASKGLTNLGRIIEYLGLILLITGFTLHSIAFTQGNLLNILPLFNPAEKVRYIRALPSTIFCFLGFEVITIVPFSKRNGSKALPTTVISIFILCFFFIILLESCYAVLGIDDIVNYDYPLLTAIRRLDIAALQFAKRLDLFFIMAWLTSIFCSVSMISFTAAEYTRKLIPKIKSSILLIIIGILAFIAGRLISNAEDVSKLFVRFMTYYGLLTAFVIPFILLIVHLCRSDPKKHRADCYSNGGDSND